jgi:hypothetical protein
VVSLTADAGLTTGDLDELVALVKSKNAEQEQLAAIAEERVALEPQIRARLLSGDGVPPLSRKTMRAAGAFLHLTKTPGAAVERSRERMSEHLRRLIDLRDRAEKMIELQQAAIDDE